MSIGAANDIYCITPTYHCDECRQVSCGLDTRSTVHVSPLRHFHLPKISTMLVERRVLCIRVYRYVEITHSD